MGVCNCTKTVEVEEESIGEKGNKEKNQNKIYSVDIQNTKYTIKVLEKEHVIGASRVFYECFKMTPTEPLLNALKLGDEEIYGFIDPYLREKVDDRLSFVAVDNTNQEEEVVALFLHEDFGYMLKGRDPPRFMIELIEKSIKWAIISALWEELEEIVVKRCKEMGITKVVHLFMWGVCHKARGKGLTKTALEMTKFMAEDRGYEMMFANCSNIFAENALRKCFGTTTNNVEVWGGIDYDNFQIGSHMPYVGCNEEAAEYLKEQKLYREEFQDCANRCKLLVINLQK